MRLSAIPLLFLLTSCGLVFGRPMNEAEFEKAAEACSLKGASFVEGSFVRGNPSVIEMPGKPDDGQDVECVAKLFGGDGVMKPASVNFVMGYST